VETREAALAEDVLDVEARGSGGAGWGFDGCQSAILGEGLRLRVDNFVEKSSTGGHSGHEALAAVLQVRGGELQVLLWQRARQPFLGAWALPGGRLGADETLERSIRRHLAAKVDVRELSHLEQLETLSEPDRHPDGRLVATAYLGLVPADADPRVPEDTAWHRVDELPRMAFDHAAIALAGRERLRAKLSYTNAGFALAPPAFTISELRELYRAALGHDVSATNLQRVLVRRRLLEPTGETRPPGRAGGRPAAVFRFAADDLEVTDQFAVLRPPGER
jgi:ADP-ribose pyrophosphatase YjhB (NUDIX family)